MKTISNNIPNYESIHEQILAWTNGHKELTEYLKNLIYEYSKQHELGISSDINSDTNSGTNSDISVDTVNNLVQSKLNFNILSSDLAEDVPIKKEIQNIKNELTNSEDSEQMLLKYRDLLQQKTYRNYTNSSLEKRLIALGLARVNINNEFTIGNLIYKKIFNLEWVQSQIQKKRNKKTIDKYHLALAAGLISIVCLSLAQYFIRYSPYRKLLQCNNNPIYKQAIEANSSLNEQKIEVSIRALKELKDSKKINSSCLEILYDLQYSQAIYLSAGINNKPMKSVEILCEIPKDFYENRTIQPWFTRWSSLYRNTSFPTELTQYLSQVSCPAQSILFKSYQ